MKICPICNAEYSEGKTCPKDGATLISSTGLDDMLLGETLKDAYKIEEKIGIGGMGAVYRANQVHLDRKVAVKVLLPRLTSTPDMVKRFFLEARMLSKLNHPNILSIIDFGNTETGLVYMVMEYLEGRTLQECVPQGGGLSENLILHYMEQMCDALDAAHAVPMVHRDLKPANIFVTHRAGKANIVKVLDFGIGKMLDEADEKLTQTGIVMGTPGYISPEQIAQNVDPLPATDIYALGGILYFMMGGDSPFHKYTGRSALAQQLSNDPDPIAASRLASPALQNLFPVVLKAMRRHPEDRYQRASDLMADLRAHASGENKSEDVTKVFSNEVDHTVTHRIDHITGPQSGANTKPNDPPTNPTGQSTQMDTKTGGRLSFPHKWKIAAILLLLLAALTVPSLLPGKPLVFGMSADFSGPNRELGREMKLGIETYFNKVNQEGGIRRRPLELLALDDKYEPEPARANMIELITERGVFGIIGNVGTPTAQAAVPVAMENKVLFFGPLTGGNVLRKDPPDRYVFNYRASYREETRAIVAYFLAEMYIDPHQIAVFSQNDGYGDDGFQGVMRMLRDHGIREEEILHVRYERNQFDIQPAIDAVLAEPHRARAIVTIGTYKQTARFIQGVKEKDPDTLFSSVSFVDALALAEEFKENDPTAAESVIVTQVVPFFNSGATQVAEYREALAAFAPNEQPGPVSLEGYIAAQLLVEGLRQAEELTTEAVVNALENLKDYDLGTGASLSFSKSQHQASSKVWALVMDKEGNLKELRLDY